MRSRFKRNERLYQIALRSPWTFSAKLALAGLVIGVWLVPLLLGDHPELRALGATIHFLGWVFAIGFAGIAVYRFISVRRAVRAEALETSETSESADEEDAR